MELKEKAKRFAIKAHMGQVRKSEKDKPMIIHPISVGMLLEEYGYSEEVIAAGYLHDVVEDTKYTINDIKKRFGNKVADLVLGASEEDKSLSWEERKSITIEKTKSLPLENKLIICADKIDNLEDIYNKFRKFGNRDFSTFNRGEEQQKWYYTNVYNSLIENEDKDLDIFKRLKDIIDLVFNYEDDESLRDIIFDNNREYYEKLKKLDGMKKEIIKLKRLSKLKKPYVIEFTGTPRTGKTSTINNLYDFFKKGGFKVKIIEEFTTSKIYKDKLKDELNKYGNGERNIKIAEYAYKELSKELKKDYDVILIDRSINDRQIWNYRRYLKGEIEEKRYYEVRDMYKNISKDIIDFLVVTYAEPIVSLKRDYNCNLALEKRSFLNIDNILEFNNSLNDLKDLLGECVNNLLLLDTSELDINSTAIRVANEILIDMRCKYINNFKDMYKII